MAQISRIKLKFKIKTCRTLSIDPTQKSLSSMKLTSTGNPVDWTLTIVKRLCAGAAEDENDMFLPVAPSKLIWNNKYKS